LGSMSKRLQSTKYFANNFFPTYFSHNNYGNDLPDFFTHPQVF